MTASAQKGSCSSQRSSRASHLLLVALLVATTMTAGCGPTGRPTVPVASPPPSSPTVPASPSPAPSPVPSMSPTAVPTAAPTALPSSGDVLLDEGNTDRYVWEAGAIVHPHGLVVLTGTAYLVDASQLVAISLSQGQATRLLPADGQIERIPVGEIIALAADPDKAGLLLLDKRGDLYHYDPAADHWSVQRPIDRRRSSPNPVPCAVAAYNGRAYILDTNYSQVWRYPFGEGVAEGYLPGGDSPENRAGTALDITRGIDLAVDGNAYVLLREDGGRPAGLVRFTGAPAQRDEGFATALELEGPTRLHLDAARSGRLYVLDREGKRLRALDRRTADTRQTFTFSMETVEMRAVYTASGWLYIATPDALYVYPGTGQVHSIAGGAGPTPLARPDTPQRLTDLPALIHPLTGLRYLPERDSLLPGTPRVYRYGIHHGLDLYSGVAGGDVSYGQPVHAVASGVVVRADHDFQELTPAHWDELSALCAELHMTPPQVENLFRGRQVWVDHGNGVVSRYDHLSGIPDDILTGTVVTQGQVIAYVGNSGTREGTTGSHEGVHLHFELYLEGHYLGEWLSLVETRRLWQRLLFP